MNSLRQSLFLLAQKINLHTPWLNGVKKRLGIHQLFENALRSPPTGNAAAIAKTLNDRVILDQVQALRKSGIEDPDFYILLVQSLGDIVACEPIPRYLKTLAPQARIHWILLKPFKELVSDNPCVDETIGVTALSEGKDLCARKSKARKAIIIDCHFDGTSCPKSRKAYPNPNNPQVNLYTYYALGTLLDGFALAAGLPRLEDGPEFHFNPKTSLPSGLPQNYAVFHCGSNETCRNWKTEKWLALSAALRQHGLVPVEIGTERMLAADPNIVNLTGKRSLQQLALVISSATAFVGIDSVFAHVANAVRTPSVILLGKYRCFESYMPYSGPFAHSGKFAILRAPRGKRAEAIPVADALAAVLALR